MDSTLQLRWRDAEGDHYIPTGSIYSSFCLQGTQQQPQRMRNTAGSHPSSGTQSPAPAPGTNNKETLPSSKAKEWRTYAPPICLTILYSSLPYITHCISSPQTAASPQLPSQNLSAPTQLKGVGIAPLPHARSAPYAPQRGLPVTNTQLLPLRPGT